MCQLCGFSGSGTRFRAADDGSMQAAPAADRDPALVEFSDRSGNDFVDSLIFDGRHWVNGPDAPDDAPFVINYFFDVRDAPGQVGYDWRPYEKEQFSDAIQGWANVANVAFRPSS